jgi:putative addiction module CopG family antidote
MRTTQQMSITLPLDMARMVKAKVEGGHYASESEVIREGLRALQEREAAVEAWLKTEVAATYDAYKADPAAARSLGDVLKDLNTHMDRDQLKG